MSSPTIEKAIKHSLIYTFTLTQPLFLYATPTISAQTNDKIDSENESALNYEPRTEQLLSTHEVKINDANEKAQMKSLINKEKKKKFKQMEQTIEAIQYGEKSKDVKEVQKLLAFYGYYTGDIDAIYGPLTEKAILSVEKEGFIKTNEHEIIIESQTNKQEVSNIQPIKTEVSNDEALIATAKEYIGVPYNWGGTTPNGFDCSGFIQFVYASHNETIPRTTREIWNFATNVSEPSIGDLLFFETYQPGPSHLGIYLGNGDFIHASSSNGVTISNYQSDIYWKERFIGAKTIY